MARHRSGRQDRVAPLVQRDRLGQFVGAQAVGPAGDRVHRERARGRHDGTPLIAPSGTVGIHHPYGDVKKITAGPQPTTTDNCISNTYHANTHWLTGPYSQGTTEGGSSGSALFSSASSNTPRRAIGILSGGDAACSSSAPSQPNSGHDCYGKLAVAWTGTGTSSSNRLRDWLDPGNTGTQGIDGIDQGSTPPATGGDGHSRHAMPGDIGARIPWH